MEITQLYATYIRQADRLIDQLGVREELVQNDTVCLQVPTDERYLQVKQELLSLGTLISESRINGRLIAVVELAEPLSDSGWTASFVELPQPKTGTESDGVRHLQFVTRTGIDRFRNKFPHLAFDERGNPRNRLLEISAPEATIRFHDKSMGAVIAEESSSSAITLVRSQRLSTVAEYAYASTAPADTRLVFLAGSCPLNADGSTTNLGDFSGQAAKCIENLRIALDDAGATIESVLSTRVLVASSEQKNLVAAWEIVRDAFGDHDVPSTLMGVTALGYDGQLVEVEAVAAASAEGTKGSSDR